MKIYSQLALGLALAAISSTQARAEVSSLTIDASDKTNFVFYGLEKGQLVPVTEQDSWIFGVRRYIFKTPTGSNGTHQGGSFLAAGAGFSDFQSCAGVTFTPDEVVSLPGYTISANLLLTSDWYDYSEEGAVTPQDKFFAISSDSDCLKVKISAYDAGVYTIDYSQLK